MIQTELIFFLSPQIHFCFHNGLGHGVTSTPPLKSTAKDHSLHQACRSNLLNTISAAPCLLLSPTPSPLLGTLAPTSWFGLSPLTLSPPSGGQVTFLQCWAGCVPALAYLPPLLPITFSPSTLTPCQLLPSGPGQSSLGPFPSLHHTPVTLNALWFWNKPLSCFQNFTWPASHPPTPCLEYPPSASP